MRNIDRLGSPPISGANCAKRVSRSSISERIGWRTSVSYSSRCASHHGFSLCRACSRKKRNARCVNGMTEKIWRSTAGSEDRGELLRRHYFQLMEGAVTWALVGTPAAKLCGVSKAVALHMVVGNLDDELRTQRLPRQIFPRAPTTLRTGAAMRLRIGDLLCGCPGAPGMTVERIIPIRRQKRHQLSPFCVREARANADLLEISTVVVEAEQQRAYFGFFTRFVPAEAGNDAIAFPLVFDFQHDPLVRLVGAVLGLRDDAVESRALESAEPVRSSSSFPRSWRQV